MSERTVENILIDARTLLADTGRWTRGLPAAITITGQDVEPCDADAVAWSVDGALQKTGATGALYLDSEKAILAVLGGTWGNITDWENWPARRHTEVIDLLTRSILGVQAHVA